MFNIDILTSLGQVDFSSRLEMTCNETNGAKKFRRWRCNRPTWLDLENPSRLESTWSTWLPGLIATQTLPYTTSFKVSENKLTFSILELTAFKNAFRMWWDHWELVICKFRPTSDLAGKKTGLSKIGK